MKKPQRTVLIVDDSPEDRGAFRRFLDRGRRAGYTFYEAQTAAEGLERCREFRPDVILLDYGLPDESGLSFLMLCLPSMGHTHSQSSCSPARAARRSPYRR